MTERNEWITLPVDGSPMRAFVVWPDGEGPHPGIVVFQEAFGVNAHIRDVTARFAREGYVAIAPELFHRTASGFEGDYADFDSVKPHFQALTTEGIVADARAAHGWLAAEPSVDASRLAGVGFCMGGRAAFLANATLPLAAAVSYYGGGIAPALLDRAAGLHGPQLFHWGGRDAHIPPEQHRAVVDALRAARRAFVSVEYSEADHGFFCDRRSQYHPDAAVESWALTRAFLRRALAPSR
jgi:carboxymethylenebutenolidase